MKNNFWVFLIVLLCGKAYALPQDLPCGPFILMQKEVFSHNTHELHNSYEGYYHEYVVEADTFWQLDTLNNDADCGTSGCLGRITNTQTNQTEDIRLFCNTVENGNFNKIECFINNDGEYFLKLYAINEYRVELCGAYYKFIKLDECEKCFCKIYDSRDQQYASQMRCTFEAEDILHCIDGNTYLEKYYPNDSLAEYENCPE